MHTGVLVSYLYTYFFTIMTNVISDIPFFEGKHKTVGIVLIFIGVICFVAANHLKKGERYEE
ncbi:hypothetical protein ACT4US_20905 [Bacillus sp. HC-Mk]